MSRGLEGRGVLVVGGADASAVPIVTELARCGAVVISSPPGTDLAREVDVDRLFEWAMERLPALDVVVVCAESAPDGLGGLAEMSLASWNASVTSVLQTGFLISRRAIEEFLSAGRGGRIVAVGPVIREGQAGQAAGSALQGAWASLARSVTKEYGRRGIACNTVAPVVPRQPDVGPERGVIEAVLFLSSAESSYVNGETLRVVVQPRLR